MNAGTCIHCSLPLQQSLHNGPAEERVSFSRFGGDPVREQLRFALHPRSSSEMATWYSTAGGDPRAIASAVSALARLCQQSN